MEDCAALCQFYGWTFRDLDETTFGEFRAAASYMNKYRSAQNKS